MPPPRAYHYVGPEPVRAAALGAPAGTPISSRDALVRWIATQPPDPDRTGITTTFVVTVDGVLRVAPRRSEHVACAAGQPVLTAGELRVSLGGARILRASNLSTGYCPEPTSWPALAAALDRAGIAHGSRFDDELTFRRCPACGERNLVKDDWFVCAVCDAALPAHWNFAVPPGPRAVRADASRITVSDDPHDVIGTVLSLLVANHDRADLAHRLAPGGPGAAIDTVGAVAHAPTRDWLPEPFDRDPALDPEATELWVLTRERAHAGDAAQQLVLTGAELRALVDQALVAIGR